jgi:large subunit ribosomal protein L18
MATLTRNESLKRRHQRVRAKISGTAARPRLCIHRSLRHIYAQLVDDSKGITLASVTTNLKANKAEGNHFSNQETARKVAAELAAKAREQGIDTVVFDRGGYSYHGVVKAFGDAAREAGLKF